MIHRLLRALARAKLLSVVAVCTSLYVIWYTSGIHAFWAPLRISSMPHRALSLALMFILGTTLYGVKKERGENRKWPWYDYLLLLAGVIPSIFFFFSWEDVLQLKPAFGIIQPRFYLILSGILLLSMLEMVRRSAGLALAITAAVFLVHPFVGRYLPWLMHTANISPDRILYFFYAGTDGVWGFVLGVATGLIFPFVIFSHFMLNSGAARFFVNFALSFFGGMRGGPAKVAVIASAFFGMLSGSGAANVVGTGTITIPMMKRIGYKAHFAGAVEAAASNGGHIMPPVMGSVAFVMADFIGVPYSKIILYAAIPALMYFWAIYIQVDLEAARQKLVGLPRHELPSRAKTLKEGWFYLIPPFFMVISLTVMSWQPVKAALVATVLVILVSWADPNRDGHLTLRKGINALENAAKSMVMITFACAVAGIMIGSIGLTAIGIKFSASILAFSGGNLLALALLTLIASLILGLSLSATPVYVTLAVLVAPSLIKMGVPQVVAHLSILYWGMLDGITPPVAVTAYVAAGLAGAPAMKTAWAAFKLAIGASLVPLLMIFDPALAGIGDASDIAAKSVSTFIGMWLIGIGLVGFLGAEMNWMKRAMFFAIGGLLLVPDWVFNGIGVVAAAILLAWQVRQGRRSREARQPSEVQQPLG